MDALEKTEQLAALKQTGRVVKELGPLSSFREIHGNSKPTSTTMTTNPEKFAEGHKT